MKKWSFILLISLPILVFSQSWEDSFDSALALASEEEKPLILVFSGSDWCGPCMKLDRDVWQTATFEEYAQQNFVLYKADFPKRKGNKLSPEHTQSNKQLAAKYNPEGFFPLVVVFDQDGKVLGKTGFKRFGPKKYIAHLESFLR